MFNSGKMVLNILGSGTLAEHTAKGCSIMPTETYLWDNFLTLKPTVRVNTFLRMEKFTLVLGPMIYSMVTARRFYLMEAVLRVNSNVE